MNPMLTPRKFGPAALALAVLAATFSARAAEPDKLLPSDSQVVVVLNVRQMLDSPLVQQFGLEKLKEELAKNEQASKALKAAGLDPFKDVDTITVAGAANLGGKKDDKNGLVVVRGRFDAAKIKSAVEEVAKDNAKELKIESKGGTPEVYAVTGKGDKDPMFVAFADKNTMVVSPAEAITRKAAGGEGGELNADLKKALGKVGGKESLYFALALTDEMKQAMGGNPKMKDLAPKLESVTGSVNVTDGVAVNLAVNTSDEKAAKQVQAMVKEALPAAQFAAAGIAASSGAPNAEQITSMAQDLIKRISVKTADTSVNINLTVDKDTLEKLKAGAKGDKEKDDKDK
jgi:hypothetical protein